MKVQGVFANVYGSSTNKNLKVHSLAPVNKPVPLPSTGFWVSFSGAEKVPVRPRATNDRGSAERNRPNVLRCGHRPRRGAGHGAGVPTKNLRRHRNR